MSIFSTGVIENRNREVTNISVSISNESTVNANVQVAVYFVPAMGVSSATVYFLNEFSLNPFNTPGSILTFDNIYANFDQFGVRLITGLEGAENVAVTVTGLDNSANQIFEIFPGEVLGPQGPPGSICSDPLPTATQIVYVNKAGNDATADGSKCKPFLTVTAAMASILDASPTKRYAISIGPGQYIESLIHLKANVQLVGTSTLLTRLSIPFDINDPSWFETGFINDNRSGFVDLTLLTAPLNFNFVTASSFSGKLFFVSVNLTPAPTFTALTTSVNQVNIRDSMLSSGYIQNGINMSLFSSFVSSGNIVINSQATTDTQVNLVGGGINGNIIVNVQSGHIPIDPLNITSFSITENIFNPFPNSGRLIVNGMNNVSTRLRATVDSIPIRSRVSLTGTSTTLIRVDDAFGLAYTPANPTDWTDPDPTTVQEALDRIAASIGPV
ncbi:exosporium leader peptide [Paenibacillus sp. Marseille-Q7038]